MDALALQVDTQVCLTILSGLFDCCVGVSQDAALALLAVLEDCINFIAAFGSGQTSHLSAETSLESFVCDTMLQVQVRPLGASFASNVTECNPGRFGKQNVTSEPFSRYSCSISSPSSCFWRRKSLEVLQTV